MASLLLNILIFLGYLGLTYCFLFSTIGIAYFCMNYISDQCKKREEEMKKMQIKDDLI